MSSNKKRLLGNIFTANIGRGCDCGKPKLSDVFEPKPKPKTNSNISDRQKPDLNHYSSSSTSSWEIGGGDDENYVSSTTTFSLNNIDTSPQYCSLHDDNNPIHSSQLLSLCPKISNSLAVVKDSDNPYLDFRHSMLQMILEKEIYSKQDLQELLNCFLQLNSRTHHDIIVQAFMEIMNGVIHE